MLGFGHIMLSPGDVPLLNRWRFITSFFTYMPCMMISLFVVGMRNHPKLSSVTLQQSYPKAFLGVSLGLYEEQ